MESKNEIIEANDNAMQVVINAVNTESRQDKIRLLNALDTADGKLVDMIGKIINVKGIYAETHYSQKKQKQVCRVLILADDGKSYASGSFVMLNSLTNIVSVLGVPSPDNPLTIEIIEQPMQNGNALKAKVVEG